jgi:cytidine deaminase
LHRGAQRRNLKLNRPMNRSFAMELVKAARRVRDNAHAPYSGFKVGAALRAGSGRIFAGCNVENASYPEGTCAETGALAALVAAGETQVTEVAIIADGPRFVTPCGGCRQRLMEFAIGEVAVTMVTLAGDTQTMSLATLLPGAFTLQDVRKD